MILFRHTRVIYLLAVFPLIFFSHGLALPVGVPYSQTSSRLSIRQSDTSMNTCTSEQCMADPSSDYSMPGTAQGPQNAPSAQSGSNQSMPQASSSGDASMPDAASNSSGGSSMPDLNDWGNPQHWPGNAQAGQPAPSMSDIWSTNTITDPGS